MLLLMTAFAGAVGGAAFGLVRGRPITDGEVSNVL